MEYHQGDPTERALSLYIHILKENNRATVILKKKKKHRSNGNENVYFSLIDRCDKAECLAFVYLSFYTNRLPFKKKLSML